MFLLGICISRSDKKIHNLHYIIPKVRINSGVTLKRPLPRNYDKEQMVCRLSLIYSYRNSMCTVHTLNINLIVQVIEPDTVIIDPITKLHPQLTASGVIESNINT